jgi:hypothetical protein
MRFQQDDQIAAKEHDAHVAAQSIIWSRINEAITIAALSGTADTDFRAALKIVIGSEGWYSRSPTTSELSIILNAIDQWLTAARALPAARRSAALFAADQLLGDSGGLGWDKNENPPIRQRLQQQGAEFNWLELGDGYEYRHTWLNEALQLDADGRVAEMAFLDLMERGFETSSACLDQHSEGFRAVITKGEEYLHRKPNSPIQSDIQFMMAQAYGDIVDLALGGGPEGEPDLKYQSEVASARVQAIEHYRLAFKFDSNSPRAQAAWPEARRLASGLSPTKLHFYCFYD